MHVIKRSKSTKSMLPFKMNKLILKMLMQMSEKKDLFWWGGNVFWFPPINNFFHELHLSFIVINTNIIECSVSLSVQISQRNIIKVPSKVLALYFISISLYHLHTSLSHIFITINRISKKTHTFSFHYTQLKKAPVGITGTVTIRHNLLLETGDWSISPMRKGWGSL